MEEYTGDTNNSDEAHIVFSISPILKKVEKKKDWCRKNELNIFLIWICMTLNRIPALQKKIYVFFAPKLKALHLSSRY